MRILLSFLGCIFFWRILIVLICDFIFFLQIKEFPHYQVPPRLSSPARNPLLRLIKAFNRVL